MADTQPAPGTPASSAKSLWIEYTHEDGRKYYYHTLTKQTVWQKPNELKTPKELALEASPWKEYKTPDNKPYYHNSTTSVTLWKVPEEYQILVDQLAEETKAKEAAAAANKSQTPTSGVSAPSPSHLQAPSSGSTPSQQVAAPSQTRDSSLAAAHPEPSRNGPSFVPPHSHPMRAPFPHQHGSRPPRFQQSFVAADNQPKQPNLDFATKEEAKEAFTNLLKETGVTSTWTWEQAMRAIVSSPMYKALQTVAQRKAAFQDYVDECRIQEKQELKARQQKQRQDFLALLQGSDKVTHNSRYSTISRLFAEEPAFKAIEDNRLRQSIFEGYVSDLIRQDKEETRQRRKIGMAKLLKVLQSMPDITLMTRWLEAKELLQQNAEYKSEAVQALSKVDQLNVYEDHIKILEKEYDQRRIRERILRKRAERKRREAFKELLAELRSQGQLNAKSCWMQIHPLVVQDPRYQNALGQPGSTPMELFWDLIEDLDERLYQDRKMVQDVLKGIDYEVLPETTLEEFMRVILKQDKARNLSSEDLKLIFDQLLGKAIHHAKEEKRRQEKLARKKAESFRFMLKSLDPPVTIHSAWDEVKGRAESTPEYYAPESDEKRQEIFDRYIERLKERIAKNHDSDDEDGSILEDDADYHSRRSGGTSASDRKRPATSSSNTASSNRYAHGSDHSNGDHHRRSERDSPTVKRSHLGDVPSSSSSRDDTAFASNAAENEQSSKGSKTESNQVLAMEGVLPTNGSSGPQEDGEVVEAA